MLFMGAPVNTYADYNYDAYIATSNGDRIRGLTMGVDDTFTLSVGGNDGGVGHGFSTSDSKVVTVDKDGKLTSKKVGEATIYLRLSSDWNKVLDSIKVTVLETGSDGLMTYDNDDFAICTASEIDKKLMNSYSSYVGDVVHLVVGNNGDAEEYPDISEPTWTTSDPAVATVENGKVTAKGVGTATITVKATLNVPKLDEEGNEVTDEDGDTVYEEKECAASLVVTVLPTPEETKEEQPKETAEQKQNPKTGDMLGHVQLAGVGTMLVLALGVMLRIGKNKKQTEVS